MARASIRGSRVDQHTWIQDGAGVHCTLRATQLQGEEVWAFAVIAWTVDTTDRVVVRHRAASGTDRRHNGALDLVPLSDPTRPAARCDDREVRRGAVGVHVGQPTGDNRWPRPN